MSKKDYFQRSAWVSFFTALTTLATQILLCRVINAKFFNNFAFLMISLTMLGFAISGVILAFNLGLMRRLHKRVHALTWLFILTFLASSVLFYKIPLAYSLTTLSRSSYLIMFAHFILISFLFVIPFVFCGLILGILLAHQRLPVKTIYCFDLAGSAIGALVIVPFIALLGVEKSMVLLCCLFLIGVNISFPLKSKFNMIVLGLMFTGMAVCGFNSEEIFKLKRSKAPDPSLKLEYAQWDPIGRIEVSKIQGPIDLDATLAGTGKDFSNHVMKYFTINNTAGAWAFHYTGDPSSLKPLENTEYYAAYRASSVPSPKVLIIGLGAGMDVLAAMHAHASEITAVEINGATLNILTHVYKDYFKQWVNDPKVRLVHDEGRHYLSRFKKKYDIIQLTGVDTYSSTMASANIFSENHLYTKEAIKLYFGRLNDKGVINITRMEYPDPPREMLRMEVTTVEALREIGVKDPSSHMAMLATAWLNGVTMVVKKEPFTASEIKDLTRWTAPNPYLKMISLPGMPMSMAAIYEEFLEIKNPKNEKAFIDLYPLDISSVEDDRPFFFHYTRWKDLFDPKIIPFFEFNIVLLLFFLLIICMACIFLPLKNLMKSSRPPPFKHRYVLVFSCIGIGYFFIEIALLQKLGLFLGHPNYSICVVLSGLLLSTGIGSLYSRNTVLKFQSIQNVTFALVLLILGEGLFVLPNLHYLIPLSLAVKAMLSYVVVFPVGFLLGVYMPEALDGLKKTFPNYVPWAWGINGIFSVVSPVAAMAVSVTWGIKFQFILSLLFYLLAGKYLSLIMNDRQTPPH
jgi:hypothetical protein